MYNSRGAQGDLRCGGARGAREGRGGAHRRAELGRRRPLAHLPGDLFTNNIINNVPRTYKHITNTIQTIYQQITKDPTTLRISY